MGAKLWYLSCPAVSQISNFTVVSFTANVCVRNAAPIVDSCIEKFRYNQLPSSDFLDLKNFKALGLPRFCEEKSSLTIYQKKIAN
jgi:hypothetical protein